MNRSLPFFREYDIRGIYGEDITIDVAYKVGRSAGKYFGPGSKVNVARDTRKGSVQLSDELIRGLVESGCNVTQIGEVPSPLLYYSVVKLKSDFGVMVTASHLPPDWNGFKFCDQTGQIISKQDGLKHIQLIYESENFKQVVNGTVNEYENIVSDYKCSLNNYLKSVKKGFKVTFDLSNSVPSLIVPYLLDNSGTNAILINDEILEVPIHDVEPNEMSMQNLRNKVLENGSKLGIMYDADGDRMAIVDNKGRIFADGTTIIALFALMDLEKSKPESIVLDVTCPSQLGNFLRKLGFEPLVSRVGHGYCSQLAKLNQSNYAAQFSGHIALRETDYRDDAIFSSIKLLEFVSNLPIEFSQFIDQNVPSMHYVTKNIEVQEYTKFKIIDKIRGSLLDDGVKFDDLDGIRITEEEGGYLIRASNTSNKIRIMAEGKSLENARYILGKALNKLNSVNLVD